MKFVRKPFHIEAIQVTIENMAEVANWCGGEVRRQGPRAARYIQVPVVRTFNDRQSMAFTGDWVTKSGNKFKVYTDSSLKATFDPDNAVQQDGNDPDYGTYPGYRPEMYDDNLVGPNCD